MLFDTHFEACYLKYLTLFLEFSVTTFLFFQLVPVHSCWSRQHDYRTSVMLWTNSRQHIFTLFYRLWKPTAVKIHSRFAPQGEVAEHVVSHRPGAKASSDFATFPVSSYIKVNLVHMFF